MKSHQKASAPPIRKRPPATTPAARENQMIALAIDLAEKQMREGTASSQVITHYLKLGSTKEKLEKDILEKQRDLITAKTDSIKSVKKIEEMYQAAMEAFTEYKGSGSNKD